jgi:hypothetical protein
MTDKTQEAIRGCQQEVIVAAEQKLGRTLTAVERLGIESITSLMMLDSCCQSFSSSAYTRAQVLADLEHFAKQAQKS